MKTSFCTQFRNSIRHLLQTANAQASLADSHRQSMRIIFPPVTLDRLNCKMPLLFGTTFQRDELVSCILVPSTNGLVLALPYGITVNSTSFTGTFGFLFSQNLRQSIRMLFSSRS